jgi:Transposase DDE domain
MAFSIPPRPLGSRFTTLLHSYAQDEGLPFASVLTEEQIQEAATAEGVNFGCGPNDVFTPAVTLWAFVGQFLSGHKSCVAAVARVIVLLAALNRTLCSAATGAYCKARAKLSEKFLRRLTYQVGTQLEDQAPSSWRWRRRRALLVDGTTVPLPDTPENQRAYPQSRAQRPGMGFPTIRLVVLLTFATATLIGAAWGRWRGKETGESALFRQLFDQLRAGDVVVADRYYCSYFLIALLQALGVDVAFRLHHLRHYDFRRGRRLGRADHVVEWQRPQRPTWMSEATYAAMPETLTVRELRFHIDEPGYRTQEIVMATTLLDDSAYSKDDIADLYGQRWQAELDLRSIKQTLGMEMLTCKTPEMVHKEIWAHLLGYNLVRKVAAQAAWERGLSPRQISFAGTVQTLEAFAGALIASATAQRASLYHALFVAIATHRVGNRPDRVEPRRLKRRIDKYPMLRQPRAEERARLINGEE